MRKFKVPKQKTKSMEGQTTVVSRTCQETARARCVCGFDVKISWWWPWCIVAMTTGIRIHYVMLPRNWWILHPDEIFQSVEVAFSEVYGYGFRPYEYLPPPNNASVPAEVQLLQSGMYGLRSSIYPKLFMLVLYISNILWVDYNPYMVCRIFNVAITSLLPASIYWFVLKIFNCRLFALLACILSAVEHHLAVFGTHTIVNSFISPWVFAGLALILHGKEKTDERTEEFWELDIKETSDQNGNIVSSHIGNCRNVHEFQHSDQWNLQNEDTENKESCTRQTEGVSINQIPSRILGGFLIGMSCYIRPDTVLFCVSVILSVWWSKKSLFHQNAVEVTSIVIGGAIACVLGITDDFWWYGSGVISPVQWFQFNILSGKSGQLFGTNGISFYVQVFTDNAAQTVAILPGVVLLIFCRTKQSDVLIHQRTYCAICFSFVSTLLVYSSAGHKEKRFIHNAIILYLIMVAYGFHTLFSVLRKRCGNISYSILITMSFLLSFVMISYSRFPTVDTKMTSDWTYGDPRDSIGVNVCLDWLRGQDDVNGVFLNASLYDSSGFTILKHDVPMLVNIHHEFYLFDREQQNKRSQTKNRVRTILNYSDFVHESNQLYLDKLLSKDRTFNYAVTNGELTSLLNTKYLYDNVFTYGDFSVFRLNFGKTGRKITKNFTVGSNATVLEYEANWLITNGLYRLAIERIQAALELNKSRVRLYQQMFICYHRLNDKNMLFHYQEKCFKRFGKTACVTQQEKIVLHEDYNKFYL